jgi:alkylation response protein AidB-like acyl-CoA dehydrogenase
MRLKILVLIFTIGTNILELNHSSWEMEFKQEVTDFVLRSVPPSTAAKVARGLRIDKEDIVGWQKILHAQGWGAVAWPKEHGGQEWNALQQSIFDEVCSKYNAPIQLPFGLKMVAPVIMKFGSVAQQQKYLPRIIAGLDWWCQGYSEPGSGSDLASLKTKAERASDHYVVNGQKTWTTLAQHADMIFCLVRTNHEVRKQEGISFLLIDMKSPGITVRPIQTIDGEHEINEVWFDNVKVPLENLVGEENKGWTYAKYLLSHERTNIAQIGKSKRELSKLIQMAASIKVGEKRLLDDPRFTDQIAELSIELDALNVTNMRVIGSKDPAFIQLGASILKIKGSEIQQRITELQMQALGPYAMTQLQDDEIMDPNDPESLHPLTHFPVNSPHLPGLYFNYRKASIYGGSNEIQRNIIAKLSLDL